jgi:hypothetical protein
VDEDMDDAVVADGVVVVALVVVVDTTAGEGRGGVDGTRLATDEDMWGGTDEDMDDDATLPAVARLPPNGSCRMLVLRLDTCELDMISRSRLSRSDSLSLELRRMISTTDDDDDSDGERRMAGEELAVEPPLLLRCPSSAPAPLLSWVPILLSSW